MISYRTLLFGTIAVIAAAAPVAPAIADSVPAMPLAVSSRTPLDSVPAMPLTRHHNTSPTVSSRPAFAADFAETVLRFEEMLLRIAL